MIAGQNVRKHSDAFEESVPVWVFEEMVSCLLVGGGDGGRGDAIGVTSEDGTQHPR